MKIVLILFTLCVTTCFAEEVLTSEQKSAIVRKVYNKVFRVMSKEYQPKFKFERNVGTKSIASYGMEDGAPVITFEEAAFDVCAEFGDRMEDAIALIIGHEIAHHKCHHKWQEMFESTYRANMLDSLKYEFSAANSKSAKMNEAEADERGGIYCYIAGYNPLGLTEQLFTRLYSVYQLGHLKNYPKLEERLQIAREVDSVVSTYISIFETGNYAMLLGENQIAIDCFENVIYKNFHSREIYNNLGVVNYLKAISFIDPVENKFIFPVEIDLVSRFKTTRSKGNDSTTFYLEAAKKAFEDAVGFDEDYATGYLNLACVYALLGKYRLAENQAFISLEKSEEFKLSSTEKNARLVLALIDQLKPDGEKKASLQVITKLSKSRHLLANLNLQIIQGKRIDSLDVKPIPISWMDGSYHKGKKGIRHRENINGLKEYTLVELGDADMIEFQLEIRRGFKIITGLMSDSKIVAFIDNTHFIIFHSTLSNYADTTTLGLKLGSTQEDILQKYGMPTSVLTSSQGTILGYNNSQLVMVLNDLNQLESWMVWKMNADNINPWFDK